MARSTPAMAAVRVSIQYQYGYWKGLKELVALFELIAVSALALFVVWGVRADPSRPFSWAMYTGATKGFLCTDENGVARVPSHEVMRLSPESHRMSLQDLRQLVAGMGEPVPVEGLIIGSRGNWQVGYDSREQCLISTPLPDGEELEFLAALLRRCV